jgi:ABC-type bacteriocin/lantibiotic exporter with double-glycine peptidase domain
MDKLYRIWFDLMVKKFFLRYKKLATELEIWNKKNLYPAILLCVIQLVLAALDLLALGLLTLSVAIASSSLTRGNPGDTSQRVLDLLNLSNQNVTFQVIVLGGTSISFLIMKTLLSLIVFRISLEFVRKKANDLTSYLIRTFFVQSPEDALATNRQKSIWILTSGSTSLSMAVYKFFLGLMADSILIVVIFVGLASIDLITAILALVLFSTTSIISFGLLNKHLVKKSREKQDLDILSSQNIQDYLSLYKELIVRHQQKEKIEEIVSIRTRFIDSFSQIQFLQSISKYVMEIVLVVSMSILGVYVIIQNDISRSIAVFTLFLAGSGRMLPAILRLQSSFLAVNSSISGSEETLRLIRRIKAASESKRNLGISKDTNSGFVANVEFKSVNFGFGEKNTILNDLSFQVLPNTFFGVIGPSGVGKSTLLDLMLGLRLPRSGEITISGLNPTQAFIQYPGKVAYVPQEVRIIGGSIASNMSLGGLKPKPADDFILRLMALVQLEDLVERFGLRGSLGENDFSLSGGQRQRLGIARALSTNPQLLILDEATSALDFDTEEDILEKLRRHPNLTVVLVTHRLRNFHNSDTVLYLGKQGSQRIEKFGDLREFLGTTTRNSKVRENVKR